MKLEVIRGVWVDNVVETEGSALNTACLTRLRLSSLDRCLALEIKGWLL